MQNTFLETSFRKVVKPSELVSQSVVPWPAASESPRELLQMQILLNQNFLRWAQQSVFQQTVQVMHAQVWETLL